MAEPKKNPEPKAKSKKMTTDDYLNKFMTEYGIDNPMIRSAILGDIQAEGGTKGTPEISWRNTPVKRIREKFGARVKKYTDEELEKIKKDDVKFFDMVYGPEAMPFYTDRKKGAWNPGNDKPGDGYKYRGRGLNQLTFKAQYASATKDLQKRGYDVDLVKNPELLDSDPEIQALVAINFLHKRLQGMTKEKKEQYKTDDWTQVTNPLTAADIISNANAGWGKTPNKEYVEHVRGATIDNLPKEYTFKNAPIEETAVVAEKINSQLPIVPAQIPTDVSNIQLKEYTGPEYKKNLFGKIKEVKKTFGGQFENFNIMKKYKMQEGGQQPTPEEMAMMQQQQAAQGQQGAPQQGGGQDQAMQQIMQMVEQMIQQGAQPADVAAELLGQQVPPEAIMQVFVQMGLPEQEAQAAIEQAMQAGPPQEGAPQGPPQGQPSPEEMAAMEQQQGQPPMMWHGGDHGEKVKNAGYSSGLLAAQLLEDKGFTKTLKRIDRPQPAPPPATPPVPGFNPAYTMSAKFGQKDARIERDPTELAARNDQTRIGEEAKEKMTPEEWEQYRKDLEITKGHTNINVATQPNYMVPQVETNYEKNTDGTYATATLDNMKAGGDMFRKLMKKAWGGKLTAPAASSEDYVSDRAAMFVNAIKQNTAMSTLNESMTGDPFANAGLPSASLGGLPKFTGTENSEVNSETAGDDDLAFNEQQQAYIDNLKSGFKKIQEQGNINQQGVNYQGFSGYNPYMNNMTVGYRDPRQFTMMDELQRGTNPWARFLGNTGRTFSNPTIRGNNLPGGMSGADFLSQMKGMSGVGPDGTPYRVSAGERYVEKDGTFLKNLNPFVRRQPTRRGVRYNIDYGTGLTDGTQEGGASEEGTAPGTSGAMSKRDMLNDLSKIEKKEFRKLKRTGVSANDAYQRMVETRGGTEDPAQTEVNDPNVSVKGDGIANKIKGQNPELYETDDPAQTGVNESPRARDMSGVPADIRAEMDAQAIQNEQRGAAAAAGDAMGVDNQIANPALSDQQIYEKKEGEIGYIDEQGNVSNIAPGSDKAGWVMNKGKIEDIDNEAWRMSQVRQKDAIDNPYEDILNEPESKRAELMAIDGITEEDLALYKQKGPKAAAEARNARIEANQNQPSPDQLTAKFNNQMMLDNYGKGMRTGAPADPGITRMPLKPAFGKPGEPTIVGNGPAATADLTPNNQNSNASTGAGANPNYAAEIEGIDNIELESVAAYPQNEPSTESFTEPWIKNGQRPTSTTPPNVPPTEQDEQAEIDQMILNDVNAAGGMTYGGGVSPQALANAVNLINRAFGGEAYDIPKANFGNMGGMRMSNDSANVFSPQQIEALKKMEAANSGSGTVDVETEQGMQWGSKKDLGQGLFNAANAYTFFDQAGENARAQEKNDLLAGSSLTGAESYNQLQVGLDNQQGARFNTDFNNQNLNVNSNVGTTFSAFGGQPQMMMYGGQYYQIGGDVDLSPERLAEFEKAGFVLTRK